jgi:hypothetical protein
MMSRMHARSKAEGGIAMIVVMLTLFVLTIFAGVIAAGAGRLSSTSVKDRNSAAALQAASAGAEIARYRINRMTPIGATKCITGDLSTKSDPQSFNPAGTKKTDCDPTTGDLGNGAGYQYYVSIPLAPGDTCSGVTIGAGTGIESRCITSTGTAHGISRRIQELITGSPGVPEAVLNGIAALGNITVKETSANPGYIIGIDDSTPAPIGTNGTFSMSGCTSSTTINATFEPGSTTSTKTLCSTSGGPGFTADDTSHQQNPGWTAPALPSDFGTAQTVNDNFEVLQNNPGAYFHNFGTSGSPNYHFTYTASSRTLKDASSGFQMTLDGAVKSTYLLDLCTFNLTNPSTITLINGAILKIYMDSKQRTGSTCGGAASLVMTNNGNLNQCPPAEASQLQFYIYGTTTITFNNSNGVCGALFAPQADFSSTAPLTWTGAINVGGKFTANNGLYFKAADVSDIQQTAPTVYARNAPQGWLECHANPNPPDRPRSNC